MPPASSTLPASVDIQRTYAPDPERMVKALVLLLGKKTQNDPTPASLPGPGGVGPGELEPPQEHQP